MVDSFDFPCMLSDLCNYCLASSELAAWVVMEIFAHFLFVVGRSLLRKVTWAQILIEEKVRLPK